MIPAPFTPTMSTRDKRVENVEQLKQLALAYPDRRWTFDWYHNHSESSQWRAAARRR